MKLYLFLIMVIMVLTVVVLTVDSILRAEDKDV